MSPIEAASLDRRLGLANIRQCSASGSEHSRDLDAPR